MTAPYRHKVQYYETDKMGITHHANYVHWMEEARVDFLEQIGFGYDALEAMGVGSPVMSVTCRYKAPTTFADEVTVTVRVAKCSPVRIWFQYDMTKANGKTAFQGESEHCFVDPQGKLLRLDRACPALYAALTALAAEQGPLAAGGAV